MELTRTRLYQAVFKAAKRVCGIERESEAEGQGFALLLPGEPQPAFACFMHGAGIEGLTVVRGVQAFDQLLDDVEMECKPADDGDEDEAVLVRPGCSAFFFCMMPVGDIRPEFRAFLKTAGASQRADSQVPLFTVTDEAETARPPRDDEVAFLLPVLNGILKANATGVLDPGVVGEETDVLTLAISGDPLDPEVEVDRRRYAVTLPTGEPDPDALAALRRLPRLAAAWLVAWDVLTDELLVGDGEEDDGEDLDMIIAKPMDSEIPILIAPMENPSPEAALAILLDAFRGENAAEVSGIPPEVQVNRRGLWEVLKPLADRLGVRCLFRPCMPEMTEAVQHMLNRVLSGRAFHGDDLVADPAPDDLEAWRGWCLAVRDRVADACGEGPDDAIRQFFGDPALGEDILQDSMDEVGSWGFQEWMLTHYRATPDSQTLLETLLAGESDAPARALLQSRLESCPTVYRVKRLTGDEEFELEDLLFGGTVRAYDVGEDLLSLPDVPSGWCLPGRIVHGGSFRFLVPMGPWIGPDERKAAIAFLESKGMQRTRESVMRNAHLFGWLWGALES